MKELLPCFINLLFAAVLFVIVPVAVYRFYRKECDYSSGKSFGLMVVIEIVFIIFTISYVDIYDTFSQSDRRREFENDWCDCHNITVVYSALCYPAMENG